MMCQIQIVGRQLGNLTFKQTKIFSCVSSDISNLAPRNSSKLAQYVTLVPILLSGKVIENPIFTF